MDRWIRLIVSGSFALVASAVTFPYVSNIYQMVYAGGSMNTGVAIMLLVLLGGFYYLTGYMVYAHFKGWAE